MTRVLCWNIENFALNKIADPSTDPQPGFSLPKAQASKERLEYIEAVLAAAAADIVVVVEVSGEAPALGALALGAGLKGCTELLKRLRGLEPAADWMLVPPLHIGSGESIGVFYKSTKLFFTGPFLWSGHIGGQPLAPGPHAAAGDYPANEVPALPQRDVPKDALYNEQKPENQCAGRVTFTRKVGKKTKPVDWSGWRPPFMVSFAEFDPQDPQTAVRNVTLLGVHAPAKTYPAKCYLELMTRVKEVVKDAAKNEVRIVIGDFNLNVMGDDFVQSKTYGLLEKAGYTLALAPPERLPANLDGYGGYFATHIRKTGVAAGYTTNNLVAYYPGYSYIGSDHSPNALYAIDNAFTWYGPGTQEPAFNEFTILNALTSTPFKTGTPYGKGPKGSLPIGRRMTLPTGTPAIAPKLTKKQQGLANEFKNWEQYGRIRNTSDHLPIVLEI